MYEQLEQQDHLIIETNLIIHKLASVIDVSEIPGVDGVVLGFLQSPSIVAISCG